MSRSRTKSQMHYKFILELEPDSENDEPMPTKERIDKARSAKPTVVQTLVSSLKTARQGRQKQHIATCEGALLNHLHSHSASLSDVEAIIPALNYNVRIMRKLAVNIGWHHAQGHMSNTEAEQILAHIVATGDWGNELFEQTKARIAYHAERTPCTASKKQNNRQAQRAHIQRDAKTVTRSAKSDRDMVPAILKERKAQPEKLPVEFKSAGDITTEVHGMSYAQALETPPKVDNASKAKKLKRAVSKIESTDGHPVESSFWARSRLHNGPGLQDRKQPSVRLPPVDERRVSKMSQGLSRVALQHCDGNGLRVETGADIFAGLKISGKIVVKLPVAL